MRVAIAAVIPRLAVLLAGALVACTAAPPKSPSSSTAPADAIGTSLPIVPPATPTITERDARNATAPPRFEVKAPKGAPGSSL
jgi:arylsulfatase